MNSAAKYGTGRVTVLMCWQFVNRSSHGGNKLGQQRHEDVTKSAKCRNLAMRPFIIYLELLSAHERYSILLTIFVGVNGEIKGLMV